MKKTRCPACGKTAFQSATYVARRDLDGRRFTADVPARKCASCAELLISGPGLAAFERAITLELARGGEVGPDGFRWLRKAAGLKAVRLAELLDVTPMQVSRWENGRKPLERRAVALVSALALEQVEGKAATRAVLEALAAEKKLPKRVRLDVNVSG
jgi:DNA-binding transcriptional regulator YiaG